LRVEATFNGTGFKDLYNFMPGNTNPSGLYTNAGGANPLQGFNQANVASNIENEDKRVRHS